MKVFLLLIFILLNSSVYAQITRSIKEKRPPLIELGAGIAAFTIPDYPGAENEQTYVFPYPVGLLRGKNLRVDEEGGARTRLINKPSYEFSISASMTFSSRSEENPARTGMPNLDGLGEIGPSIIWHIKRQTIDSPVKIGLSVPVRFAFSTDWKRFDERGFVFNPFLYFIHEGFLSKKMNLIYGIDTRFATERYMDFYYQVDPQYAIAGRPAYDAKAGYLATGLYAAISYTIKKVHTIFIGAQYSSLKGSKNRHSALLAKDENILTAIGYTWWFYQSDTPGYQ
jgi:outer membrane protein